MRKFLTGLILIPLGVLFIVFAFANRHLVTVTFDPFDAKDPSAGVTLPLFVLTIVLAIFGVVAGWAVSRVGNVVPGFGHVYLVVAFMVVVTGGVGKLAGTIVASLGIGGLNKLIEPSFGAVYGKVFILVLVILFLQWRPSGLFAMKGRHADSQLGNADAKVKVALITSAFRSTLTTAFPFGKQVIAHDSTESI